MRARLPAEKLSFAARRHSCQPRAAEANFEQAFTRFICVRNTRAGGSPEAPSMKVCSPADTSTALIIATGTQHVRQLAEPMRGRVERIGRITPLAFELGDLGVVIDDGHSACVRQERA